MGREERTEVVNGRKLGVGVVDVSCQLLAMILATGWSTGTRSLLCTSGIPKDAVFTGASFYPGRAEVRLYYRSAEIPYQEGHAHQTPVEVRYVDMETATAAEIVGRIEDFRDRTAVGLHPGWWARLTRRNVGTEAQVRALSAIAANLRNRFGIVERTKPAERPTP